METNINSFDNILLQKIAINLEDNDLNNFALINKYSSFTLNQYLFYEKYKERSILMFLLLKTNIKSKIKWLEYFIKKKADIHLNNDKSLRLAILRDNFNITKILLENGANLQIHNYKAFRDAIKRNKYNIIKLLLEYGADLNVSKNFAINYAIKNNNFEIVKLLFSFGAKIDNTSITYMIKNNIKLFFDIIDKKYYNDIFEEAICEGNIDLITKLMEKDPSLINKNFIFFISNCKYLDNQYDILNLFLDKGLEIKNFTSLNRTKDPIMISICDKNYDISKVLIELIDIDINSNYVDELLKCACDEGDSRIVNIILDKDYDYLDLVIKKELGIIKYICNYGDVELAKNIIGRYPDINWSTHFGLAIASGNYKIVKILLNNGVSIKDQDLDYINEAIEFGYYKTIKILYEYYIKDFNDINKSKNYLYYTIYKLVYKNYIEDYGPICEIIGFGNYLKYIKGYDESFDFYKYKSLYEYIETPDFINGKNILSNFLNYDSSRRKEEICNILSSNYNKTFEILLKINPNLNNNLLLSQILEYALDIYNYKVINILLKHAKNNNINIDIKVVIYKILENKNNDGFKIIFKDIDEYEKLKSLAFATYFDNIDIVKYIIKKGIKIEKSIASNIAYDFDHKEIYELLKKKGFTKNIYPAMYNYDIINDLTEDVYSNYSKEKWIDHIEHINCISIII